ncbi:MAG: DUF4105 domain-containing protein [Paludibacteraceae bacterium]|nr:DUF4105 domain-containing protein [Paludibacteraceae bacterium]
MRSKIRTYLLALYMLMTCGLAAQTLSEGASISLLTCTPGEELYARYGHTAIRVLDEQNDLDVVFNYGIFDFNTDHFYWKFVRGETWYELGAAPMWWFMREYDLEKRPVYEQVLNLTPEQCQAIWKALVENYQPENRKYLYNFVFDNCATRPYQLIISVLGDSIVSDYDGYTCQTYRDFISHYTGQHTWANAGINLLFGPKADRPMTNGQRLFLPEELMYYIQYAHSLDGIRLIKHSDIGPFKVIHTPWYATWELGLVLYFLAVLAMSIIDRIRGKWSWWVELAAGIPYLVLLLIVTFLTFFSCHPLVGFGWRLLIIPLTHLCARLVYIIR